MKRVRVVSYAINGRGMGHLVRQLAILRMAKRLAALLDVRLEPWVLTSSEADTLAQREGVPALKMPSKAMLRDADINPHRYLAVARGWVLNAVAGLQPDVLVVDTFPGGSFGELVPVLDLVPKKVLVARRVRDAAAEDDAYAPLVPLYDDLILPDDRDVSPICIRDTAELMEREAAREALGIPEGRRAVYVTRGGGGDVDAARELPGLVTALRSRGWHVVVGAGPLYRGRELRGDGITWLSRYTPVELFAGLDAAVSAAGYNSFHELLGAGVPTVFVPQPRISDDQEARAARAEAAGAGKVAHRLADVPDLLDALMALPDACHAARGLVPRGGALAAAVRVLSQVLPEPDVHQAAQALTDDLLRLTTQLDASQLQGKTLKLVRLLAGPPPSRQAARRNLLMDLRDEGQPVQVPPPHKPSGASDRVDRFLSLCRELELDLDMAMRLVSSLQRTFPVASAEGIVGAAERLLPAWAPYDDWMGALSLLRAVPTQRTLDVIRFADDLVVWLKHEEDLFAAVARFSRLEGHGARTVAEVLHHLHAEAPT